MITTIIHIIIIEINKNIIINIIIIVICDSLGYYEIFSVSKSMHRSVMFFFSTVLSKESCPQHLSILKPLIDRVSFCWGCRREKSQVKL